MRRRRWGSRYNCRKGFRDGFYTKILQLSFEDYDLLIVDECSTISARDMKKVLQHRNYKMILLCGDTYQIQSIEFGNWFSLLRHFLNEDAVADFNNQFRSQSEVLLNVWNATRNLNNNLQELFDAEEISHQIDDSIFEKQNDDEIILCLNYDGLYGINNINKIIQCRNTNEEIKWKQYTFKVGDPILFYETKRFSSIFHNNTKGKILNVSQDENKLYFKICIHSIISTMLLDNANVVFAAMMKAKPSLSFPLASQPKMIMTMIQNWTHIFHFKLHMLSPFTKRKG